MKIWIQLDMPFLISGQQKLSFEIPQVFLWRQG